ncbi:hypothetical protein ABK040_015227 [Willaertia magna]
MKKKGTKQQTRQVVNRSVDSNKIKLTQISQLKKLQKFNSLKINNLHKKSKTLHYNKLTDFQFLKNIEINSLIGINNLNNKNLLNKKIENENLINNCLLQLFLNKKLKYMDIDECVTKIATITQERNGFDFGMFGNNINYDRDNTINPQIIFLTNKGKLFTFGNDIYQNNQLNNNQQNNTLQSIKTLTNKNNNKLTIPSKNQLKKTNKISDNQNELPIKTLNNLISEKIIDIINGVSHCIIVTEKGNIFELTKQGLQLNCKLLLKNITNLKKIVCGMSFTIILTNDNRVFKNTWELYNPTFNLENNDELIEMACGAHHVLFLKDNKEMNEPIPTQWNISAYRPDSSVYLFIYASINLIIILTRQKIDNTFILENLKHRLIDLKLCDITINH